MANITVKDSGNADVVYVAATPSAGDKSPAQWRFNAASAVIGQRPVFTVSTRDNGSKNGRHLTASFRFPVVVDVAGIPTIAATVPFTLEGVLPTNVDSTAVDDAFVQLGNLLVSDLIRSVAQEGFAPT
jgi:hypothetical protein